MATHASSSLDMVVTVKVHFDGVTRRSKMALRDMSPKSLEAKIRAFLHIPEDYQIIIERYSDSAGSFIRLDPANTSVYKQLYRAAKAKSKLKLRVVRSLVEEHVEESVQESAETETTSPSAEPKPVTVEDAPEEPTLGSSQDVLKAPMSLETGFTNFLNPEPLQPSQETVRSFSNSNTHGTWNNWNNFPAEEEVTPENPKFAICCNSCDKTTKDVHYHCSTCEDGDFDLCESCVALGITCHGSDHWLIKRFTKNGQIINSTTETMPPKPKPSQVFNLPPLDLGETKDALARLEETMSRLNVGHAASHSMRTCNSCVEEYPEAEFLHCQVCDDFDLCRTCFSREAHGHHPAHGFQPAVAGTPMPEYISVKLGPGRNKPHYALCDGCDKFITGVRHKCLDCPDWDYCEQCMPSAGDSHPDHRFVSIYEPLQIVSQPSTDGSTSIHTGIYCDGPICTRNSAICSYYIRGIRYKCAVCHDVDFCETCEASPENKHNKTHPLIKFKTAVRHVSVTTTGEHADGHTLPPMGDRLPSVCTSSMDAVRTVVDMKPAQDETEPLTREVDESKPKVEALPKSVHQDELRAVFVRDQVVDGTILPPDHVFEQSWVLRNEGQTSWPAGCVVKFVSGDYMGHVDSAHPAEVSELASAAESSVCQEPVAPGEECAFKVQLRTPARPGKIVSYWRLATPTGHRFGHHMWCSVSVRAFEPKPTSSPVTEATPEVKSEEVEEKPEEEQPALKSSQMIFPKLEKESPVASVHEEARPAPASEKQELKDDFEDQWDMSEDNFITDDEYDILDASDEEFLEEQQKKLLKK